MKNENKFILELCKFKNFNKTVLEKLLNNNLDFPYILGQLLFNRVGATAFYVLKKAELLHKLNREFRNTLKSIYNINKEKTNSFSTSLNILAGILDSANFKYAILKGGYLINLYEPGLRTSNDIDILINQEDISKLSTLLKANGFVQGYIRNDTFKAATRIEVLNSRMNRGETVPFIKKVNLPQMEYLEIDINFSLDFKAKQETNLVKTFLDESQKLVQSEKYFLFTLSKPYFLIHLCTHLYKEATVLNWVEMGRDLSLYKFVDIYLFIYLFITKDFAKELITLIQKYGLEKECYYSFLYTNKLFNINNENFNTVIEKIKPKDVSFLKQIISPTDGKIFQYNVDFISWVFSTNRKRCLYESKHDE